MIPLTLAAIDMAGQVTGNLGLENIGDLFLILGFCIMVVSCAKDSKIGVMVGVIMFAAIFIFSYEAGWPWQKCFIALMITIVLLVLNLFVASQQSKSPYVY